MNENVYDTVIIGSGPAGLTAAIYNIRANLKTIVLGGDQPGGQLTLTTVVDNYPGFANGIGGIKLMMDMQAQVRNLGVEIRNGIVKQLRIKNYELRIIEVELDSGETLKTKAVIIATGAKARWLGLPNEKELIGKGVSACATCDGMFFRDKIVAVVGGGDVAGEDALFLAKFATKVYVIHRRDKFRMLEDTANKIKGNPKMEIVWDSEVVEINSKLETRNTQMGTGEKLENIKIKNNKTGEEKIMAVDGLFVAVGHDPATGFVKDVVELKESGHVVVGKNEKYRTMTSVEGIFAAGDNVDDIYRQAIAAAGDGCRAGIDAERWIGEK
ncbi:MAG: FAD-dependent oxidoreductase [Microgenomates group bacterium]